MPRRAPRPTPTTDLEAIAVERYGVPVAGVDEAGRGPWAGPVVAAAVILDPDRIPAGLADSKLLAAKDRESIAAAIVASAAVGIGIADVDRIDRDNILAATLWAMRVAIEKLPLTPAAALIDGNHAPDLPCPALTIVKGDRRSSSIAAASIIAKVTRDRLMIELAARFPGYGFEHHKGYGTTAHREAISRLGITPQHRRSFRPIRLHLAAHGVDLEE